MKNSTIILVFLCFGSLFLACYAPALFQDRQFGFRDAGHYYYPLHERVQKEWDAGRWPLWEPEENAGMPLMGNPTAAVLYPGKLVFAVLPYAWAARIYTVMHTALAFVAMLVLLRSWGMSWPGSGLGALSYTFGEPILFQYCNVIYLVGAAWLPLGIHAVDRWVRLGRRWGLCELAGVLAMQVLGGDPQTAYLLGLAAAGYASGVAWSRAHRQSDPVGARIDCDHGQRARPMLWVTLAITAILLWSATTVAMGVLLPTWRERHLGPSTPPLKWMPWMPMAVATAWGIAGLGFLYFYYWRQRGWRRPLGVMWLGLGMSAVLAASLTAAQLLPVIEFTQLTTRATAGGLHDIYPYSIEPYRLAELIWPNVAGSPYGDNSYWPEAMRIPGIYPKFWVPSLYLGGITVMLALGAPSIGQRPPWRVWMSVIAVVSLLGALGQYTSPIWAVRTAIAVAPSPQLERLSAALGPLDAATDSTIRQDGFLRDGDGSIYWWMATILPGFRRLRYPAKLFTFTALALAALAGAGWDQCCASRLRRTFVTIGFLIVVTLCALAAALIARQPILAAFRSYGQTSEFGPLSAAKAYDTIVRSLLHGLLVIGLGLLLVVLAHLRPRIAGAAALIVMALDLAAANSVCVMTVPQSLFEHRPAVAEIIAQAEAQRGPVSGPFRVHRMSAWSPPAWSVTTSTDRVQEFAAWQRDTIQPKYGIEFGIEYTHATGFAELADYDWYFSGHYRPEVGPALAKALGTNVGGNVVYYPRRAYDLWNTRYFVVSSFGNGWRDGKRASAAFRVESELIYPDKNRFAGPNGNAQSKEWLETQDFEVLRNEHEFPRSWVVHSARALKPIGGLSSATDSMAREELFYPRDVFWTDPALTFYDPHEVAWVNRTDLAMMRSKLSGQPPAASESVKVTYASPQRAILDVTLESPGLVILADVDYPGWQLTIDGRPAPIYRVNVVMRGALVSAGPHHLVYSFAPRSFQVGLVVSAAGLAAWLLLAIFCALHPVHAWESSA